MPGTLARVITRYCFGNEGAYVLCKNMLDILIKLKDYYFVTPKNRYSTEWCLFINEHQVQIKALFELKVLINMRYSIAL